MRAEQRYLARIQLDSSLERFSNLRKIPRPAGGWLRGIREALGMSGKQFARRLGVSPPRITALEQSERSGAVTIKSMQQAADALDCVFICAVLPRESLEKTIRKRAEALAHDRIKRVHHSMLLEAQQLTANEQQSVFKDEVERLMREMPKELWEEHDGI